MIDTVRFKELRHLHKAIRCETSLLTGIPDGWGVYPKGLQIYLFVHRSGLTAKVAERQLVVVQASLSRIFLGKNSIMLQSDEQIEAAFNRLEELLSELFERAIGERVYTRIDLVWQLKGRPRAFIGAYRFCRHPEIRLRTVTYEGSGVFFPGTKMLIRIYDKGLEENRKPSNLVRVEIQLKGRKIGKYLGALNEGISFERAYQAYRAVLVQLVPKRAPRIGSIAQLLAVNPRLFDLWAAEVTPRRAKDVQKQIAGVRLKRFRVSFKRLLPSEGPPQLARS